MANELHNVPLRALLDEINRRCDAMVFACILTEANREDTHAGARFGYKDEVRYGGLVCSGLLKVLGAYIDEEISTRGGLRKGVEER